MNAMHNQNGESRKMPLVFKFKGQMYLLIAWLMIVGLWSFMGFAIETGRHIRQEPVPSGELIFLGSFLIILFIGALPLRGRSDIVIDDQGISRRLLGWTWQTIRWEKIRVIRTFQFVHPALNKMVRGFNIYPSISIGFSLLPTAKMAFSDQAENMSELIEIMNHYITKYKIPVERTQDGVKSEVDHI